MSGQGQQRKLAAIMFTDMVGYSSLTQKNEGVALELLQEHRTILRPLFAAYGGNEIKTIGDAFLVEFESALQAVRCAIELQKSIRRYNETAMPERKVHIRIGIHLGDIVLDENDVYGDGVNICARVQAAAKPDGICISQQVFDQVHNKIGERIVELGFGELKNIDFPTKIYSVMLPWEGTISALGERVSFVLNRRRKVISLSALVLAIVIAGLYFLKTQSPDLNGAIPGRKSVAVLPFVNMSDDKQDEYFSDGITEDVITQLSKIKELTVISRTSAMTYKNTRKQIPEIGEELGVNTILEGSVRRFKSRIRIVAQLIDCRTDRHIWAETFDQELTDVFEIQRTIAERIAEAFEAQISSDEKKQLEKEPTGDLSAYDLYLKGREYYYRYRKDDNEFAIELFRKALEKDPKYALAMAGLADAYSQRTSRFGLPHAWIDSAIVVSKNALAIDSLLPESHKALGLAYQQNGWFRKALQEYHNSLELNPNYAPAVSNVGLVSLYAGEFEQALYWTKKSVELSPTSAFQYYGLALAYFGLAEDTKAVEYLKKALLLQPDFTLAMAKLAGC